MCAKDCTCARVTQHVCKLGFMFKHVWNSDFFVAALKVKEEVDLYEHGWNYDE